MLNKSENQEITRRDFLKRSAIAGLSIGALSSSISLGAFGEVEKPWTHIPEASKPDKLVLQSWEYGTAYDKILPKFEKDWDINLETVFSPGGTKQHEGAYRLFGAGDQLDVFKGLITEIAAFDKAGMIRPITDLPGVQVYVDDFTKLTKESLVIDGEVYGLPYFSEITTGYSYAPKLEEAGISNSLNEPFGSLEELVDQGLKAKKDGVSKFPLLWPAGVGTEQLPGCWYALTWNMGGTIFDEQGNPQLGPESVARKALKWWQDTFIEWKISDPASLESRFIPALKTFNTGDYLYLLAIRDYWICWCNDPEISPISGEVYAHRMPGNKVFGDTNPYHICTATASPEWAWTLLQYMGGKTVEGNYQQAIEWAQQIALGSGFRSVWDDPEFLEARLKFFPTKENHDMILEMYENATSIIKLVPTILEPWYSIWIDDVNAEVQACLRGDQSADETCDKLITAVNTAKVKV